MIKDIVLAAIVISIFSVLYWTGYTSLMTAGQYTIDPAVNAQYAGFNSSITAASNTAFSNITTVQSNIQSQQISASQTDQLDIVSRLGRVAASSVQLLISVFSIPLVLVQAGFVGLGLPAAMAGVATGIVAVVLIGVVFEILSVIIRYPVNQ